MCGNKRFSLVATFELNATKQLDKIMRRKVHLKMQLPTTLHRDFCASTFQFKVRYSFANQSFVTRKAQFLILGSAHKLVASRLKSKYVGDLCCFGFK